MSRVNAQQFIRDVQARTPAVSGVNNTYGASLNTDGSVAVTKNGATLYSKVQWGMGSGGAVTDANPSGDWVTVLDPNGNAVGGIGRADAQQFINGLV